MNKFALLTVVSIIALPSAALASGTAAHTLVVAGQAQSSGQFACSTNVPQSREFGFFSTGVQTPSEGLSACSLSGGIQNTANPFLPSSASQDVTLAFNGGVSTLSASAQAGFDALGVQALGSSSGTTNGGTYHYGEAAAYANDQLFLPGNGEGAVVLLFDIAGAIVADTISEGLTFLKVKFNARPAFTVLAARAGRDASFLSAPSLQGNPVPGFTLAPGSVSGATTGLASLRQTVTLGSTLDLTIGLYAASYPTGRNGATGIANNDFLSQARLSGFYLYDSGGNLLDVSIRGASGTVYDQLGAHVQGAIPEPANWALMIIGFWLVGTAMRRKMRIAASHA